jgi:hypothetical protein
MLLKGDPFLDASRHRLVIRLSLLHAGTNMFTMMLGCFQDFRAARCD